MQNNRVTEFMAKLILILLNSVPNSMQSNPSSCESAIYYYGVLSTEFLCPLNERQICDSGYIRLICGDDAKESDQCDPMLLINKAGHEGCLETGHPPFWVMPGVGAGPRYSFEDNAENIQTFMLSKDTKGGAKNCAKLVVTALDRDEDWSPDTEQGFRFFRNYQNMTGKADVSLLKTDDNIPLRVGKVLKVTLDLPLTSKCGSDQPLIRVTFGVLFLKMTLEDGRIQCADFYDCQKEKLRESDAYVKEILANQSQALLGGRSRCADTIRGVQLTSHMPRFYFYPEWLGVPKHNANTLRYKYQQTQISPAEIVAFDISGHFAVMIPFAMLFTVSDGGYASGIDRDNNECKTENGQNFGFHIDYGKTFLRELQNGDRMVSNISSEWLIDLKGALLPSKHMEFGDMNLFSSR